MGAALATLVTQALAALIGMVILLRGRHGIELCGAVSCRIRLTSSGPSSSAFPDR
jgi:Na+-driven multidrug efflux pump